MNPLDQMVFYKITKLNNELVIMDYCDAMNKEIRIKNDSVYQIFGHETYSFKINSINRTNSFIEFSENVSVGSYVFKPYDSSKKLWKINNELYVDSVYAKLYSIYKEPCTECFPKERCDQLEQEEKEKKERLAIEKRYDRFRDSIIKHKVAIDPKWHGTYQYDIADEGKTAGESSSVVTRDITITKDSVIIWDNGFMADFRINYLPVKSPKDTLYCFIDRDLNRRGQPKYYSSDLSPTKIYQSGKDYFFDSSLMTKRGH